MAERVGIVGVGLMGQAFAHHLLRAGFAVQGFDVDAKRMDELAKRGGIPVDSPAAAARGVRWLLTSLPTSEIVRDAVLGPEGIAEGAAAGTILADATTSRPQDSERLGAELAGGFRDESELFAGPFVEPLLSAIRGGREQRPA